jgi:hypothetical protein
MTWADFYLVCFVVGFAFSLLSFLSGGLRGHLHIPRIFHGGHVSAHLGHAPLAGGAVHSVSGVAHGAAHAAPSAHISPFNFVTFLAWFGGTGYLLTRYSGLWFLVGLLIALVSGLVGAGIIYLFLSKVLTSREENMDPADYEMIGVLGKLSSSIRQNGTGEIIYSQAGTRRTCGARSDDGVAMPKGSEVIVTRFEKGIAYVRLWEEMAGEESTGELTDKSRTPTVTAENRQKYRDDHEDQPSLEH